MTEHEDDRPDRQEPGTVQHYDAEGRLVAITDELSGTVPNPLAADEWSAGVVWINPGAPTGEHDADPDPGDEDES